MNHGSIFSGIGGFDLAAEWMGWTNVFHCEWAPFQRKVLQYHFPNSISYEDIKETNFTKHRGQIDVLTGGFPCPALSLAGKRRGADDDRYLWDEMLRAIREIRPTWIVGENVAGLLSMVQPGETVRVESKADLFGEDHETVETIRQEYVIETICRDLEREGYSVQPIVVPACAVGAPHRRDRLWIIAHRSDAGSQDLQLGGQDGVCESGASSAPKFGRGDKMVNQIQPELSNGERANSDGNEWVTPNSRLLGQEERQESPMGAIKLCEKQSPANTDNIHGDEGWTASRGSSEDSKGRSRILIDTERLSSVGIVTDTESSGSQREYKCGSWENEPIGRDSQEIQACWTNFPTQSSICGRDDGLSSRLDGITFPKLRSKSIEGYGNAVVPQVVYEIFKSIERVEYETPTYQDAATTIAHAGRPVSGISTRQISPIGLHCLIIEIVNTISRNKKMKRKCMSCKYCMISSRDNEPLSCTYGLQDGGMYIGVFCPNDKKRIRDFKDSKHKK